MANVDLDIANGFLFAAKGRNYPIQAGAIKTSHLENDKVVWDWHVALELRAGDVIPANEATAILYDDESTFIKTKVIGREKQGALTLLKLVPYFEGE